MYEIEKLIDIIWDERFTEGYECMAGGWKSERAAREKAQQAKQKLQKYIEDNYISKH